MCNHENFKAQVDVHRITDDNDETKVIGYSSEITIMCADCFKPFEFIGVPYGISHNQPMVNPDRTELRVPIKPVY